MDVNFQRVLDRAQLGAQESHVICLANAVLTRANKDFDHGYYVDHQLHIIYPEQITINNRTRTRGIADIAISVIRDNNPLLVIECKKDNYPSTIEDGVTQLQAYMLLGEYPYGLLLSNTTAYFFNRVRRGFVQSIEMTNEFDNATQIQDIIDTVAGF